MTTVKEYEDTIDWLTKTWLDYTESQYKERWWSAIIMLLERSHQPSMDMEKAHDAGLIWIALYDLAIVIGSNTIKNEKLTPIFIGSVAKRYGVKFNDLWTIFGELPGIELPHILFLDIYCLLDIGYKTSLNERDEVIQGFNLLATRIRESNSLGYLFEHLSDLKSSTNN